VAGSPQVATTAGAVNGLGADTLWGRALAAAQALGIVPANVGALTPAEIARAARRRGDGRLETLVQGYYYPVRYGRATGTLRQEEAEKLVAELEAGRRPAAADTVSTPGTTAAADLCPVCGKRPARRWGSSR
jgi:hypothetical protein